MLRRPELLYLHVHELEVILKGLFITVLEYLLRLLKSEDCGTYVVTIFVYFSKDNPKCVIARVMVNIRLDKLQRLIISTDKIQNTGF